MTRSGRASRACAERTTCAQYTEPRGAAQRNTISCLGGFRCIRLLGNENVFTAWRPRCRSRSAAPCKPTGAATWVIERPGVESRPHADVFLQASRPWLAAVNISVAVDDGELGAVAGAHARVAPGIEDEL